MPMSWDAAADAKLFTVVMAVYDIKITGAQNEKIAKMMGEETKTDVTPKAITHRLSKIKAQAASFSHVAPGTPASARKRPSTPSNSGKTSKTPASKGKSFGIANKILGPNGRVLSATHTITTLMHDDGQDDEEDFDTPTKSRVKTEAGSSKKRKMTAPKIEDFVGYAEVEGMGDAIDSSLAYPAEVKIEEDVEMQMQIQQGNNKAKGKGKEKAEVVDLTETADTIDITDELCHQGKSNAIPKGKGRAKEQAEIGASATNVKVKKEVVDIQDVYEDEDAEMVV
ncbi:hypothetical protein M436DRAFT_62014 [Aureobasidium namibiae CBS 147.97]|uniref:Uncharacterized protein n=1 Tax=Aureobasidium namibiae CBS 147.97 TaxID=1043004 RepID=A0A074X0T4_9PEZI